MRQFYKWLNETYHKTYADVKEGDHFILYNGENCPVPFVQMRGEPLDKTNRPTQLIDGCYLTLSLNERVAIVSKAETTSLKQEIKSLYNSQSY